MKNTLIALAIFFLTSSFSLEPKDTYTPVQTPIQIDVVVYEVTPISGIFSSIEEFEAVRNSLYLED